MGSLPNRQRFKADTIAIIGAGPSGLAAAKYLLAERAFSRIQIYEQRSTVGGIWNYVPLKDSHAPRDLAVPQVNPHAGHDEPIWQHSNAASVLGGTVQQEAVFMTPMYDRLETNIPRELMGFSDLNWPEECQLFPKHEEVMEYIERYAEDVRHLIRFRTQVLDVRLRPDSRWSVKSRTVARDGNGDTDEQTFDAVVVASGHFNIPYTPHVSGMEEWSKTYPGTIMHSKFYRKPEQYAGKRVILVGNSASGIDIGAQIATTCKLPLFQSQKSESFLLDLPTEIKVLKPEITAFVPQDRSVCFADGSVESDVDVVLYCTGYFYSFPFLPSLCASSEVKPSNGTKTESGLPPLVTTGEWVENLYQHVFYRPYPNLAFLALNQQIIPFPLAEAQSAVIARVWSGRLGLPSEDEMHSWEEGVKEKMGDRRSFHVLKFPMDADYIDMLHDWAMSAEWDGAKHPIATSQHVNRRSGDPSISAEKSEEMIGKEPPYWGEKEYWMRERFPAIKKAFQDFGEGRLSKRTLEDVGFSFEDWKRERAEGGGGGGMLL